MGFVDLQNLWFDDEPSTLTRYVRACLTPLEALYGLGLSLADKSKQTQVACRVVSVGNLTVGGNGKSPLVMEFASMLAEAGRRVAIVSRGYGRKSKGSRVVYTPGSGVPDARVCGDEPALFAIRCPDACVVVGEDRVDAAKLAVQTWHPDVILCDDAFQHRRLFRDLDILAVHAQLGFGNKRLLPAGPLREPIAGLARAGLVVFTYARDESRQYLHSKHGVDEAIPSICCSMDVLGLVDRKFEAVEGPAPGKVVAACAIANPAGFFSNLRDMGLEVVGEVAWRDHHRASMSEWNNVKSLMDSTSAEALVVTEKDLVRMAGLDLGFAVFGLRIGVGWRSESDKETMAGLLAKSPVNGG